jgi:hypothetical protein
LYACNKNMPISFISFDCPLQYGGPKENTMQLKR